MFVSILIIYTIGFLIWLYAFFSVLVNNFKEPNNKIVWVLLLIFIPVTAILYPFIGRKQIKRENINTENSLEIEASTIDDGNEELNVKKEKKKSKIVGIILTFIAPGLGYVYVGHIKKGYLYMFLMPLFLYSLYNSIFEYTNIFTVLLIYSSALLLYFVPIFNVISIINKNEIKYSKFSKWYFLIITCIFYFSYITILGKSVTVKLFTQPSSSMSPTILENDQFLVKKTQFIPKRGEVVVFKYPKNEKILYIKRVVATSGDIIAIQDKNLLLHPKEGNEYILNNYSNKDIMKVGNKFWVINPYKIKFPSISNDNLVVNNGLSPSQLFNMYPIIVPENEYFMMGDNRDHSNDSRFWGTVSQNQIVGYVKSIFINFNDISRIGKKIN